ncbi:MAG: ectonucleotide pyrophosphatase/phosphodiesterase [Alistipes sp.]
MKKYSSYLLLLLALTACATASATSRETISPDQPTLDAPDTTHYAIILSIDAFRWDLTERAHTPTLDSLRHAGSYAEMIPVFPANTFPSHYSMATGLHPDHHGVVNNAFYDRTLQRRVSVFDKEDVRTPNFWGGEPIWNTAERQGRIANIFMWVGSEVPINGRQASLWTPYSSHSTFYERADWVVSAMTRPTAKIPNLVMWYFEEPDATMHDYGPTAREVVEQAEHIDSVLRYFFYQIRKSPVYHKINFIVTADHGMTKLSPARTLNLYEHLDTTQVVRVVKGSPLGLEVKADYVDEAINTLHRMGHVRAWRREEMPEKYHYGTNSSRLTNIIVLPDMGWSLDYAAKPRGLRGKRGAHGYDNFERDMHTIFYGSGPAFKVDYRQHSFQNQNIYLILCNLLDIEPAPNDGVWSDVRTLFRTDQP